MTVIEFKPKKAKRKKISIEQAITDVVKAEPVEIVVVGRNKDGDLLLFHSGEMKMEMLWLVELAKKALLDGELEDE